MAKDTEYGLSGDQIKDRRINPRKKTGKQIPVDVAKAPKTRQEFHSGQEQKLENYPALREAPRKRPDHEIKAACFSDIIDDAVIINLSLHGLRIRGRTLFQVGQKLNLSFLVPDTQRLSQIPIYAVCAVIWQKTKEPHSYDTGLKIFSMIPEHQKFFSAFLSDLPEIQADPNHSSN